MKKTILILIIILSLALPVVADDVELSGNNYFEFAKIFINTTQQANNFSQYNATDSPSNTLEFYINQSMIRFSATQDMELKGIAYNNYVWTFTGIGTTGYLNTTIKLNSSTSYILKVNSTIVQTNSSDINGWASFNYSFSGQKDFEISEQEIDITPPVSITDNQTTTGNFWINNTWTNPSDSDFNHTWWRYENGTTITQGNQSNTNTSLNITYSPHYTQNLSAQTVDGSGNMNETKVWFNATIPNNVPTQNTIGNKNVNEGDLLWINISSSDLDNDLLTYATNRSDIFTQSGYNFSWQTNYTSSGIYYVNFNTTDNYSELDSETIIITVNNIELLYIPPTPISCSAIADYTWINVSCSSDSGNVTDGMNFSKVNPSSWQNGTQYWQNFTGLTEGTLYDFRIYSWNTSSSGSLNTTYVSISNTTLVTPIVNGTPNITAWYNNLNGWNQSTASINITNQAIFNVTINQTIDTVSWKINGIEEQNTSSLQFTSWFNTTGYFNVSATAYNENGTSNTVFTNISVVENGATHPCCGGGGINYDYSQGYVKYSNGTAISGVLVTTIEGSDTTDGSGYFNFGYSFIHGDTYNFNATKSGFNYNSTNFAFSSGDFTWTNLTLSEIAAPPVNSTPNIASWGNDNTSNETLTLTIPKNTVITFNATSNQTITGCSWAGIDTQINCSGVETYASKNFTSAGIKTVSIQVSNANGTSNTITWTVTVQGLGGLILSGYVNNTLDVPLENARIDFNSNHEFTDTTGYYEFPGESEGDYDVLSRSIGYRNQTKSISFTNDTTLNFTMLERKTPLKAPGFEGIFTISILIISVIYVRMNRGKNGL